MTQAFQLELHYQHFIEKVSVTAIINFENELHTHREFAVNEMWYGLRER